VAEGGQVQGKGRDRDEDQVDEPVERADASDVLEGVDDLLDEIDDVLEENAEEFVKNYVQKGGQ
jgi:prokaryotic ubiquitin-like protein Pup